MLKSQKLVFKLTYFNMNLRGQVVRALLNWAKVEWEDIKVSREEFERMKDTPILPILEYKGLVFNQSHAIEYYLAKKFKLLGSDHEEEFQIISFQNHIEDISNLLKKIIMPETPEEENLQDDNLLYLTNEYLPRLLLSLEKAFIKYNVNQDDEKYFFGKRLSLMDFLLGIYFNFMINHTLRKDLLLPILKENAPRLESLINRLVNLEFNDYYENVHIKESIS